MINFKFPAAASPEMLHHTVWRAFHRLLRWKTIELPNSHYPTHTFLSKGWENVLTQARSTSNFPLQLRQKCYITRYGELFIAYWDGRRLNCQILTIPLIHFFQKVGRMYLGVKRLTPHYTYFGCHHDGLHLALETRLDFQRADAAEFRVRGGLTVCAVAVLFDVSGRCSSLPRGGAAQRAPAGTRYLLSSDGFMPLRFALRRGTLFQTCLRKTSTKPSRTEWSPEKSTSA